MDSDKTSAWHIVIENLQLLIASLENGAPQNIYDFAARYHHLAHAYHAAIQAEGRSSMRMDAVLKALDLTTKKSELVNFINPAK